MPERPTLHTVAARAGVSIATVSKVVNGIRAGMSDATWRRVERAIEDVGYRPSRAGRGLRTLQRFTIGMAIVDPSPIFLTDPFTTNLVAGLSNHLSARDFGLLLHGIAPGALETSFLVRESVVDGLCVLLSGSPSARHADLQALARLGHPLIAFQEKAMALKDCCFVRQDDKGGAVALAERILARGARRAFMVIPEVGWAAIEERVAGFRQVLRKAGVTLTLVACDETSTERIAAAIEAAVAGEGVPDAVIGANDQIALAAIRVLRGRGLEVPADVGVLGFNAFPFAGFADPPLTTVRSPAYELGEAGAELILERLETGRFRAQEHVIPVTLVPGATA
jgi:LacI family transcriptional regulator